MNPMSGTRTVEGVTEWSRLDEPDAETVTLMQTTVEVLGVVPRCHATSARVTIRDPQGTPGRSNWLPGYTHTSQSRCQLADGHDGVHSAWSGCLGYEWTEMAAVTVSRGW